MFFHKARMGGDLVKARARKVEKQKEGSRRGVKCSNCHLLFAKRGFVVCGACGEGERGEREVVCADDNGGLQIARGSGVVYPQWAIDAARSGRVEDCVENVGGPVDGILRSGSGGGSWDIAVGGGGVDDGNDLCEDGNSHVSADENDFHDSLVCCNCHRSTLHDIGGSGREQYLCGSSYEQYKELLIHPVAPDEIKLRYKWCFLKKEDMVDGAFLLCYQCENVMKEANKDRNRGEYSWAAFVWNFLSDQETRERYGVQLWQMIPRMWRLWWLLEVRKLELLEDVSLDVPVPFVVEITEPMDEFRFAMQELNWMKLVKMIDKHILIPKVKCPWGCCKFLNLLRGTVPMDVIYMTFLQYPAAVRQINNGRNHAWIRGIHPGFLQSKHFIKNKKWGYCAPSLVFQKGGGPGFATCARHSVKTKGQYIHAPASPLGSVMSLYSDQSLLQC